MSQKNNDPEYNTEGKPLKLDDLNIEQLALWLHEKKIRTTQGKIIQPLHEGHLDVLADPARYKVVAAGRRYGKCNINSDTYTFPDGTITTFENLIGRKFKTYSYDFDKNEMVVAEAFAEDNGIKPVYKIKTKTGIELTRTPNHPLYTAEGWKSVEEGLKVGNRIFVPTQLPHEGTECKDEEYIKLLADLAAQGKVKRIENDIYSSPNDQISIFINSFFSKAATVSKNGIFYESANRHIAEDIKRLLARLGIVSTLETSVLQGYLSGCKNYRIKINTDRDLLKFVEKVGTLGKEAQIKKAIINSSKKKQSYIIDDTMPGYWDEITSLTYEGEQQTVAICVPEYQNYIVDCLEHNTLLAVLMGLAVLMQVNRRVWIVAPDYGLCEKVFRELYHILVTQLSIIRPGKPKGGRARNQKGDYYLETPWGSVLEAKSMENPDSLAGEANDLIIVDEAALQPNLEDIWVQMLEPTLMDKSGSAIFISTPRGKNHFYKLFLMGQTGKKQRDGKIAITFDEAAGVDNDLTDWSAFQRTSYDNPLLSSSKEKSKEEIDNAYRRAVHAGKVLKFRQEYLADFESVSDTCFPGFIEEASKEHPYANVVDYIWHPGEGSVYAACDHNFAKPASTIFAQVNKFNDVIIFDERFTPHTTSYMQAQQILDKQLELNRTAWKIWEEEELPLTYRKPIYFKKIIADVSGDQRQLTGRAAWDDFQEVLGVRPVGLKQPRETGSNMLRQWLQFPIFDTKGRPMFDQHNNQETRPKLFISSNCVNTIYALSTATFKKGKQGLLKEDYEETPDGHEGLIDALRYLLVYLFHDTGRHFTVMNGF